MWMSAIRCCERQLTCGQSHQHDTHMYKPVLCTWSLACLVSHKAMTPPVWITRYYILFPFSFAKRLLCIYILFSFSILLQKTTPSLKKNHTDLCLISALRGFLVTFALNVSIIHIIFGTLVMNHFFVWILYYNWFNIDLRNYLTSHRNKHLSGLASENWLSYVPNTIFRRSK
jgi:hypothetical protein